MTAADEAGLFYAAQPIDQLRVDTADARTIPQVEIADAPRFAYRSVMLDVARHFFDLGTVKAHIDRAAHLEFNHLHLSDDQGWRSPPRSWPWCRCAPPTRCCSMPT